MPHPIVPHASTSIDQKRWSGHSAAAGASLGLMALTILSSCGYAGTSTDTQAKSSELVGKTVPNFVVPQLDCGAKSLRAYRGRAVLANLWATWCPPCRHEMPALQRLSNSYTARGLTVIGIDQGEADDVVRRYIRSIHVTYPILMDRDQRYGQSFIAVGLPTSVFIGPDGTVVGIVDGEMTYQQMIKHSESALAARVH